MPLAAFGLTIRRALLAIAYEVIEKQCSLLRCMSPYMALFGHGAAVAICPLSGEEPTSPASNKLLYRQITSRFELLLCC
jgi:hypothetical protein